MEENNKLISASAEKAQNNLLLQFVRQNKVKLILIFIITTGLVIAPITFYMFWFWSNPISRDPKAFSEFGGFFGGVTGVIISLINVGILSYIAIHLEQIRLNLEQSKLDHEAKLRLFTVNREWNSEEMHRCRSAAGEIIRRYPQKSLQELEDDPDIDYTPLAVVMGFFKDLNMSINHKIISEQDATEEFGHIFIWWDKIAVRDKFPEKWQGCAEWKALKACIENVAPKKEFEKWEKNGTETLQRYIENFQKYKEKVLHDQFSP